MPLNWSIERIKNCDELCFDGDRMEAITECLIGMTIAVGMANITERNYIKFYQRMKDMEALDIGVGIFEWDDKGVRTQRVPTVHEVKAHIGLHTNASPTTEREFQSFRKDVKKRQEKEMRSLDRLDTEKNGGE